MERLTEWNQRLENFSLSESIQFMLSAVDGKKSFSTSFGIEDQMITHVLDELRADDVSVFTLDTGRLFDQTYEVFADTQRRYKHLKIDVFFPEENDVREYVKQDGVNGFYDSVESRKRCCHIRKVIPLMRALSGTKLWITGLRAEQSTTRKELPFLEWDDQYKLIKFNPLIKHTLAEVEQFIKANKVPMNSLYKKGFVSIGCAPCTRAIEPGEDFRAGRWWWEQSNKECGLHIKK